MKCSLKEAFVGLLLSGAHLWIHARWSNVTLHTTSNAPHKQNCNMTAFYISSSDILGTVKLSRCCDAKNMTCSHFTGQWGFPHFLKKSQLNSLFVKTSNSNSFSFSILHYSWSAMAPCCALLPWAMHAFHGYHYNGHTGSPLTWMAHKSRSYAVL